MRPFQVTAAEIVGLSNYPEAAGEPTGAGIYALTEAIGSHGEFGGRGVHSESIGGFFQNSSGKGTVAYVFQERVERTRSAMQEKGVDALLLSVGPDLPWLTGFTAMAMERLSMLVLPAEGRPRLVLPGFEADLVRDSEAIMDVVPWSETQDPVSLVAAELGHHGSGNLAIGDHTWSRFLVALQNQLPTAKWRPASTVIGRLRAQKDAGEIESLARAGAAVDEIAGELQRGEIPLIGRTETDIAADISARILTRGHSKVNFCIVGSGPNSSSPHHHTGGRVVQAREPILFDFGGTTSEPEGRPGYCSDTTRMIFTGQPPAEYVEAYAALKAAQEAGVQRAQIGTPAEDPDAAARSVLTEAGLGEFFTHRVGHGIGVEAHEDPYLVGGNTEPLEAGNAFSIEPGFYIPGKWGARLEDIVVATADGPRRLNNSSHDLAIVEA